jgi:hypothetical protein
MNVTTRSKSTTVMALLAASSLSACAYRGQSVRETRTPTEEASTGRQALDPELVVTCERAGNRLRLVGKLETTCVETFAGGERIETRTRARTSSAGWALEIGMIVAGAALLAASTGRDVRFCPAGEEGCTDGNGALMAAGTTLFLGGMVAAGVDLANSRGRREVRLEQRPVSRTERFACHSRPARRATVKLRSPDGREIRAELDGEGKAELPFEPGSPEPPREFRMPVEPWSLTIGGS